jgi:glucose-6-phosphate isomerase
MTSTITPGPLARAYDRACAQLEQIAFADALWQKRVDVWTTDVAVQRLIANRLGWVNAIDFIDAHRARLDACAQAVRGDAFTDVVLLGMGGSSLAPEVIRQVLGTAAGYPRLQVLDSVDPDSVRAAMARAESSLFLLASKS